MSKNLGVLILGLIITSFGFSQNGDWELEKDEDGIKVYTREIEGEDIREFKAVATINAPRKTIAQIILNISDYKNWYPDITDSEIIKKIGPGEYYVYSALDLPWPASDRDGVSKMKVEKKEKYTKISISSVNGVKGEQSGYVRIPTSYGFWKLTPKGSGTKVHFQYFANPGGSLPDWIINMFIVDNPFETLQLLKEKAKG